MHGLSPGLSDAISGISRWSFIKASFPHILHACASTLKYRHATSPTGSKLGKTETKLLYTLHWLILDAASECEDNRIAAAALAMKLAKKNNSLSNAITRKRNASRRDKQIDKIKQVSYLHPVSTIQLFVFLFVPIIKSIHPDDLDNLKLSNGLKIWEPLWAHRTPSDIPIFGTFVKKKPDETKVQAPSPSPNTNLLSLSTSNMNDDKRKQSIDQNETIKSENDKLNNSSANLVRLPSSKSTQGISSPFGSIYMGENTKPTLTLMPPQDQLHKRLSLSSLGSNRISISNSSLSDTSIEKNAKPLLKNLDIDSIQISDFENDQIKDGDKMNSKNSNNLRAPIVHMNSICSYSDSDKPSFTPSMTIEEETQKSECCLNCRKKESISTYSSSKNCQYCFQILSNSESFSKNSGHLLQEKSNLPENEVFTENEPHLLMPVVTSMEKNVFFIQ